MNREVMSRQMFANGGAAFPDLSKDGQVTQKDILMGRGVIPMQDGGMAPMPMAPEASMQPPGMPPFDPNAVDMEQAAQGAMQQGIDPAQLEGMLTQYAGNMDDLENAEDYETVINGIRGDTLPIEQRYQELASVVGPEDSQATPESVLTLLQPVMQIAMVDEGIGGLAAEEMQAPVEGALAEGIMSTVNMGGPEAQAQVPGGPAPVNFNQGGAVQYMAPGGVAMPDPRQQTIFDQQRALFGQLSDPAAREEELAEQKNLTQAQMLFDVAQGALAFASPTDRNMSGAEKLAQSFSPVLGNIGARAGEFGKFKQAQKAEDRQLDLAALQSTGTLYGAERAAEISRDDKSITDTFTVTITNADGTTTSTDRPLTQGQFSGLVQKHGDSNVSVSKLYKPSAASKAENFMYNGGIVSAVPGTAIYSQLVAAGAPAAGDVPANAVTSRKQYTLNEAVTIGDKTYAAGSSPFFSEMEFATLAQSFGNDVLTEYVAPVNDKDYFSKFGMDKAQFAALPKGDQQYLQGLPVISDQMYFQKFGMDKNTFLTQTPLTRQRLLGIETEYRFEKIDNGKTIDILRFDKNDPEAVGISIYSDDLVQDPDLFKITLPNDEGIVTSTIADISTPNGRALLAKVNEANKAEPGVASMQKIGTESMQMSAFLVPNSTPGGGATMQMSYDGGKTYIGSDGLPRKLPSNVVPVGDQVAYDVYKREKVRADAMEFLSSNDTSLEAGIGTGTSGFEEITKDDRKLVKNTLQQIRNGVGPWSALFAGVNATIGGLVAPETFSAMFKETEEGRQFSKLVYVLGRSALASSPRFAVTDLEVTGQLFPNPDKFFGNPVSEMNKIVSLMEALDNETIRLQRMRASDSPVDSAVLATAEQKLGEIARLKQLLGPVSQMGSGTTVKDLSGAKNLLKQKAKNLGGGG